jgi:hypothetical protein
MTKYIAAATIAIGLTFAAPAQAHCPNACHSIYQGVNYAPGYAYGLPSTGAISNQQFIAATGGHLKAREYIAQNGALLQRRSDTVAYVYEYSYQKLTTGWVWASMTPRHHVCRLARNAASYAARWNIDCHQGYAW